MITNILVVRKAVRRFIQKYQTAFELIFKFIITYLAFDQIVTLLNFSTTLSKSVVKLAVGVIGAIVPGIVTILILGITALYEVYSAAPILSLLVLVLFIVIYCFAARFSGKYAYAIIAIPLLVKYDLHYIVPLLLGLTATPMAIFPAISGVLFYCIFKVIVADVSVATFNSVDEALALYLKVINDILGNKDMLVTIAVFSAIIVVMWLFRRLQYSFAFEITIIVGACTGLILYFLAYLKLGTPIDGVVKGTILSVIIVCIVQTFRLILDYTGVQNVQFEYDDYYYYVKAVPKIDVDVPDRFVKAGEKPERPARIEKRETPKETDESEDTEKESGAAEFFKGIAEKAKGIAAGFAALADRRKKEHNAVKSAVDDDNGWFEIEEGAGKKAEEAVKAAAEKPEKPAKPEKIPDKKQEEPTDFLEE